MAKRAQLGYSAVSDAAVFGVVTEMRDYKLVHFVNKILHFSLVRIPDLTIEAPRLEDPLQYPFFYWFDTDNRTGFSLLGNSSNGFPLLSSLRNLDYVLISTGLHWRYNLDGTARSLRTLDGIRMVQRLNLNTVNDLDQLMLSVELHLLKELPEKKFQWSII